MNEIMSFFNNDFFTVFGGMSTIFVIVSFFYCVYCVIKGVFPVWYRIGMSLSKRRIAIFAESEFGHLKSLLVDSKIFRDKNIVKVYKNSLKKAEKETIFLVHWKEYQDQLDEIILIKRDSAALIIYAPQNEGRIDQESLDKINNQRNSVIVNFRGRLLNDVLISMVTTSYEQ